MDAIPQWITKKSLAKRLFLSFMVAATIIWLCLVLWGYHTLKEGGIEDVAEDLDDYARQVLIVVKEFSNDPVRLETVIKKVEDIENEGAESLFPDKMRIQVWLRGKSIRHIDDLPETFPDTPGFQIITHDSIDWWSSAAIDSSLNAAVRVSGVAGVNLTLTHNQAFFLFLPLVISLPLLLLPAWLMTRSGLKPLGSFVEQLDERAVSGELTPIEDTPYKDLEPVVNTTNRLMSRLNQQLKREHEFVANVAHELKTPMAVMQANIGILEKSNDPAVHNTALADLKNGLNRGNHLVQQLLRMARMEQEQNTNEALREIDLAEFLRERIAQAEPLARQRELEITLDAPLHCPLIIDTDAVAAIIDNLLDNAIKYSTEGTSIEVCLSESKNIITLFIQDQGPGIPLPERDAAFGRFKRLTPVALETDGTGLGLAIVHQACERIGADITLKSTNRDTGLRAELTLIRNTVPNQL